MVRTMTATASAVEAAALSIAPRAEDGLLDIESTAALVGALRRVDNKTVESVGADTIESRIRGTQGGLTSVARNLAYFQHRNEAYDAMRARRQIMQLQRLHAAVLGKTEAARSP